MIFFILLFNIVNSRAINKQKLYNKYFSEYKDFNSRIDSSIIKFITELKIKEVDTIGVFQESRPGFLVWDSCQCSIVPWTGYIYWIKDGKTFQRMFTPSCIHEVEEIKYSYLIRYYIVAQKKIDADVIMPCIISYLKDDIIVSVIDHTKCYSLLIYINKKYKYCYLECYFLENKENLFYEDNNSSAITSWLNFSLQQSNFKNKND